MRPETGKLNRIELPTLFLIAGCYAVWILLLALGHYFHPSVWILLSALNITLFWSIVHEVVHGHPTHNPTINRLLVLLPIGWVFPFERFRETHMQHHETGALTDPFDDPESWYVPEDQWLGANRIWQKVLLFNNTLFGRMLIGPIISLGRFYISEVVQICTDRTMRQKLMPAWLVHFGLCLIMIWAIATYSQVPAWQHLIGGYIGLSILLIRTFLEHQAAEDNSERTVIIEKNCPIAFLFLFNNLHFVHHMKPGIAWYDLPSHFKQNRAHYLSQNNYYVYRSYTEVITKYFFSAKEPVRHPFLRTKKS